MIFLGDIAHPFEESPEWANSSPPWRRQPVIVNLEGALNDDLIALKECKLFNHPSILPALKNWGVEVVGLANNHVMDMRERFQETLEIIDQNAIKHVGAGVNIEEASQPVLIEENGKKVLLLAFGWQTIRCQIATGEQAGVNPLEPEHVIRSVKKWRNRQSQAMIVALMHWNYEMELYPQPAHRQLAFAMIDAGADAVIGHHPHRVGGIEFYNGRPVAYSLGNWWLPHKTYWNGELCFAREANLQLALEISPCGEVICHWFEYMPDRQGINYTSTMIAGRDEKIGELTIFRDMGHREYIAWFKQNRIKKKLLPVYAHINQPFVDIIRNKYISLRHMGVVTVKKYMFGR